MAKETVGKNKREKCVGVESLSYRATIIEGASSASSKYHVTAKREVWVLVFYPDTARVK